MGLGWGTFSDNTEGSQRGGLVQAADLVDQWACGETPGVCGGKGRSAEQGCRRGAQGLLRDCRGEGVTPVGGDGDISPGQN